MRGAFGNFAIMGVRTTSAFANLVMAQLHNRVVARHTVFSDSRNSGQLPSSGPATGIVHRPQYIASTPAIAAEGSTAGIPVPTGMHPLNCGGLIASVAIHVTHRSIGIARLAPRRTAGGPI